MTGPAWPPVRPIELALALAATASASAVLLADPSLITEWVGGPPIALSVSVLIIAAVVSGSVVVLSAPKADTTPRATGLRVGLTFAATIAVASGLFWTAAGTWGLDSGQAATLALAGLCAVLASFAAAWAVGAAMSRWRQ